MAVCKAAAHCGAVTCHRTWTDACDTCQAYKAPCKCERCGVEAVTRPGSKCVICGLPGGMREQPPQREDLTEAERQYLRRDWGSKL